MKDNESVCAMGVFQSAGWDHWHSLSSLAEKAGAGVLSGSRRFGLFGRFPFPRQQRFELMPFGPSGDNSFKHVRQSARPAVRHRSISLTE
jgi:hypothetical protein